MSTEMSGGVAVVDARRRWQRRAAFRIKGRKETEQYKNIVIYIYVN